MESTRRRWRCPVAEFLIVCVIFGFLFAVVLPALILWVATRFMLAFLWVGYTLMGNEAGMESAFPRYYAWLKGRE